MCRLRQSGGRLRPRGLGRSSPYPGSTGEGTRRPLCTQCIEGGYNSRTGVHLETCFVCGTTNIFRKEEVAFYRSPEWHGRPPLGCEFARELSCDAVQMWQLRKDSHQTRLAAYKKAWRSNTLEDEVAHHKGQIDVYTWKTEPNFEWLARMRYRHYDDLVEPKFLEDTWHAFHRARWALWRTNTERSKRDALELPTPEQLRSEWQCPSDYNFEADFLDIDDEMEEYEERLARDERRAEPQRGRAKLRPRRASSRSVRRRR